LQGRGGADLLAVVVIIGAGQVVQGAGSRRRGLLLYAAGADGAQVVRSAGVVIWCRWCSAAASSGRRVVLVCCWPSWSSSGRGRWCKAQAARHHRGGRPRRARPGQKEKAQGGGAGGARVALGLCRRCWSAADPAGLRRGRFAVCRRGQILHFTG
jgi:hypothetical protein